MTFTSVADVTVKSNDTSPFIRQTLLDFEGNPVDIAAATVVFTMWTYDNATLGSQEISGPADNDQVGAETLGHVSYEWQDGDTALAGVYVGEWEVTFVSGEVETFPNDRHIRIWLMQDLGGTTS